MLPQLPASSLFKRSSTHFKMYCNTHPLGLPNKTHSVMAEAAVNHNVAEKVDSQCGLRDTKDLHDEEESRKREIVLGEETNDEEPNGEVKEEVAVEIEPKTGISFPSKLDDGKKLNCVGLRTKSILGFGLKIYGFGIYADNERLRDLLKPTFEKAPAKPAKEMYQKVIDSDVEMMMRLVIVFSGLTMTMVRNNFNEGLGAAIKKLTGGKTNEELTKKVMGESTESIKLTSGSVIEISRLPAYTLRTKVNGEVVSNIESELLCRAYIYMYLGDDAFDKDAKEKFGMSLLTLF